MDNAIHCFEKAGLGKAPFQLQHITEEGGKCQYCGTAIRYRFYIQGQDGNMFFVGSDCVIRTGDGKLTLGVKKHQKMLREERENAKITALEKFLGDPENIAKLCSEPHPHNWYAEKGKSKHDYVKFVMKTGSKSTLLKLANSLLCEKETSHSEKRRS